MKRIEANDPIAMTRMGIELSNEGDCTAAIEYWAKAADLGDAEAHFYLSISYWGGRGVQKD